MEQQKSAEELQAEIQSPERQAVIREKLMALLARKGEVWFTEVSKLIPEAKGGYAMYMPMKEGYNPNVLWTGGVNVDFIEVINKDLITDKVIDWKPMHFLALMADGAPMIANLPLASLRRAKGKKECWCPAVMYLPKKEA